MRYSIKVKYISKFVTKPELKAALYKFEEPAHAAGDSLRMPFFVPVTITDSDTSFLSQFSKMTIAPAGGRRGNADKEKTKKGEMKSNYRK